ncbi:unnamed protein product, partial [Amoebophrya sp. A120]|eukprot:GSA120T00013738001.1
MTHSSLHGNGTHAHGIFASYPYNEEYGFDAASYQGIVKRVREYSRKRTSIKSSTSTSSSIQESLSLSVTDRLSVGMFLFLVEKRIAEHEWWVLLPPWAREVEREPVDNQVRAAGERDGERQEGEEVPTVLEDQDAGEGNKADTDRTAGQEDGVDTVSGSSKSSSTSTSAARTPSGARSDDSSLLDLRRAREAISENSDADNLEDTRPSRSRTTSQEHEVSAYDSTTQDKDKNPFQL